MARTRGASSLRKPSLRRVPTQSLDELRKPSIRAYFMFAVRCVLPPVFWGMANRFLFRDFAFRDADRDARMELMTMSSNYLAALGLLYAIYLGITFQTGSDRLRDLRGAISSEASSLQSVAELALTLSPSSSDQRARLHSILSSYVDHVLSRERAPILPALEACHRPSHAIPPRLPSRRACLPTSRKRARP